MGGIKLKTANSNPDHTVDSKMLYVSNYWSTIM